MRLRQFAQRIRWIDLSIILVGAAADNHAPLCIDSLIDQCYVPGRC
jgi:hypothetical protein